MLLLFSYILIAVVFSFACSVFEAVLLSSNHAHIELLKQSGRKSGHLLARLKDDVSKPLAAILTLNTIAHTIGAAGAGAQAAAVFGNAYIGVASAILTLLILVFSEIIPKTLGATYWRELSPLTAYSLKYLVIVLYPFVKLSEIITRKISTDSSYNSFSRAEFAAMAEISSAEGQLLRLESKFVKNLMELKDTQVKNAMTPRRVIFSLPEHLKVETFFNQYADAPFSRIPVYRENNDNINGYVFRSDLLLAQAQGHGNKTLSAYKNHLPALLDSMPLIQTLNEMLKQRVHLMLAVNEYGSAEGIITLEDVMETMLGFEIVDETDQVVDMQKEAKKLWQQRAAEIGFTTKK